MRASQACERESVEERAETRRLFSGSSTDLVKVIETTAHAEAQPMRYQGQGAIGARVDWLAAKMTKFVGWPVSMLLGPWVRPSCDICDIMYRMSLVLPQLVVVALNIVSAVLSMIDSPPVLIFPIRQ